MRYTVRVRGRGRVRIAAHGIADAEHLVEKELVRLWPGARVRIQEVARAGPPRIVEEFELSYLVEGSSEVVALRPQDAPAAAYRSLRSRLAGSRYHKTEWEGVGIENSEE